MQNKVQDSEQETDANLEIQMTSESISATKDIERDIHDRLDQDWISVGGDNAAIRELEETVYAPDTPENEKFAMIMAENFQIIYLVQKTPKLGRILKLLPFNDLYHIEVGQKEGKLVVSQKSYYHEIPNLTSGMIAKRLVEHLQNVASGEESLKNNK